MKIAFFDLDGTLTDSAEGIFNSIKYALQKMNRPIPNQEILTLFIGPPIIDSLQIHCGMTEAEALSGYKYFQERYGTVGKFENVVYAGIPEMLQTLAKNDVILGLATSKPEVFARQILDHFKLTSYFKLIKGADNARGLVQKVDVLREALDNIQKKYPGDVEYFMVGDRLYDISAANALNCISVGVSYGFGKIEELEAAKASVICESPQEVAQYILTK